MAIFSGNTAFRQVRYQNDGRTLVCYKNDWRQDPMYGVNNIYVATEFADPPVLWPQNSTIGLGWQGFVNKSPGDGMTGRYTVYRSNHWVYEGTGLQDGQEFSYEPLETIEVDGAAFTWENGLPVVTGADQTPLNFTILGVQQSSNGYATMGIYSREGGGTVFNAATMGWGRGLWPEYNPDDYGIVQQITRNVINRLSSGEPPPLPTYPVTAVSFTHQPTSPLINEEVKFTAIITPSYASPPITYTWQFGDSTSTISTTANFVSHTYHTAGTYTVSLTAANVYHQSSYTRTIEIVPQSLPEPDNQYIFLPIVIKKSEN